jgi:hypothetical protein
MRDACPAVLSLGAEFVPPPIEIAQDVAEVSLTCNTNGQAGFRAKGRILKGAVQTWLPATL